MAEKTCKRCGLSKPLSEFYCRHGQPEATCRRCQMFQHMERRAEKHGGSYAEARRQEAILAAQRAGRPYAVRGPRDEYERSAPMRRIEKRADKIRKRGFLADVFAAEALYRKERYWDDSAFREARKAEARNHYWQSPDDEVARVRAYKLQHPDRNNEWSRTRHQREAAQAVSDLTRKDIDRLKAEATRCAYCGSPLRHDGGVQVDHMVPLCRGGEHSFRNIVVVCASCNSRKATLGFAEWVDRIEPEHRFRVVALWEERYACRLMEAA